MHASLLKLSELITEYNSVYLIIIIIFAPFPKTMPIVLFKFNLKLFSSTKFVILFACIFEISFTSFPENKQSTNFKYLILFSIIILNLIILNTQYYTQNSIFKNTLFKTLFINFCTNLYITKQRQIMRTLFTLQRTQ